MTVCIYKPRPTTPEVSRRDTCNSPALHVLLLRTNTYPRGYCMHVVIPCILSILPWPKGCWLHLTFINLLTSDMHPVQLEEIEGGNTWCACKVLSTQQQCNLESWHAHLYTTSPPEQRKACYHAAVYDQLFRQSDQLSSIIFRLVDYALFCLFPYFRKTGMQVHGQASLFCQLIYKIIIKDLVQEEINLAYNHHCEGLSIKHMVIL